MLDLHTLGSVHVADETGRPMAGAATQRRTLALLVVLSVAGEAGLSRDKLLALLWPEVETDRARHSLTQALYATRRALKTDDLFVVSAGDIRLNFDRIGSDVRALEAALAEGELERAAQIYAGPFLDGFFISGAPEFEQWSSAHRERIQSRVVDALDQLASRAESAGEMRQALEWRRRLGAMLPLDSASTVKLMAAMARTGDRAGAVQQARLHATLLRQELDLDPDPVVEALATELRAGVPWTEELPMGPAPDNAGTATPEVGAARSQDDESSGHAGDAAGVGGVEAGGEAAIVRRRGRSAPLPTPALAASRVVPDDGDALPGWVQGGISRPPTQVTLPLWMRWAILSVVVLVLVGAGVLIGRLRSGASPTVGELAMRQRVVVAPFRTAGADPSLAYLRDGMVELLSTRLADDSAAKSVDAGAVLGAWRAAGLAPAMDVSRDTVVKLAGQLGAERVVVGSVVGTPSRLILRAAVLTVPGGEQSAEASIAGPVDSLTTLIDRLAGQLLVSEAGEDEQLAHQTTASLPALRAFLAGQAALRTMDYATALRQYEVALRRDTAFALAALQAATAADRLFDAALLRRHLATAWTHRDALSEQDRLLLSAYVGARYPAPATSAELRASWQRIIDRAPASADVWFTLGSRIFHDGVAAALPSQPARAAEAFQRALAAGSFPPARGFLALLGAAPADSGIAAAALGPFSPYVRWRAAAASGDRAALARIRDTMFRLGPANLRAIAMGSQYDAVGVDDGAHAIELLGARASRVAERVDVLLAAHAQALQRGQPREALAITMRLQALQPAAAAARRLRVLDALYGGGDSTAATAAVRELRALTGPDPSSVMTTSESWSANQCVLAQWSAARGDAAGVRRTVAALRARTEAGAATAVSAAPGACADLLEGSLAVLAQSADARSRVQRLDSLVFAPQVVGDLDAYAPIFLARLHERLGDAPRALAALRRRTYMTGWPRYLATALREEARLAQRTGDFDGMRSAYERYLALRGSADADTAADLAEVRRQLSTRTEQVRP